MDDTVNAAMGNKDFNETFAFIDELPKKVAMGINRLMAFAISLRYFGEGI